jgi:hypothetical protein
MKAGDKVTVTDGSWSKKVENGRLISALANLPSIRGQHWTIIETDCVFPLEQGHFNGQPSQYRNDTVIQGPDGVDDVVFIHSGFLKLVNSPKPKKPKPEIKEMSKFEVEQNISDKYYIGKGTGDYMHRDGEVVHECCEFWPTREQAQAVLDKFQPPPPPHVWVHGDVFRTSRGSVMFCVRMCNGTMRLAHLRSSRRLDSDYDSVARTLSNTTFLFNIKDKL